MIIVDAQPLTNKHFTGISTYLHNLLDNIELPKRNHILLLTYLRPKKSMPNSLSSYKHVNLNMDPRMGVGVIKWYTFGGLHINKLESDAFWGTSFVIPHFVKKRTKTIVNIYGTTLFSIDIIKEYDVKAHKLRRRIFNKIYLHQIKYSIGRADVIVTISESAANDISGKFPFSSSKIEIVSPGIDKDLFKRKNSLEIGKVLSRYHIESKFILVVNMSGKRKNFKKVVDAFCRVKTNGILCVVGTLSDVKKTYGETKLRNRFKYLGYVGREELPCLYSGASAFIAASEAEGFDVPPLEARACGTYVIASDIPVHREVLRDEATYFSPYDEDELVNLIEEALNETINSKDSKIIEKYDWNESSKKMMHLLEM